MKTRNIDAYRQLHEQRRYGNTAVRMRRFVEPWVQLAKPASLLDYGAGQGGFVDILNVPSAGVRDSYAPAIPQIAARPQRTYDMVLCIDVMEHIEPYEVADVLADIATFAPKALFGRAQRAHHVAAGQLVEAADCGGIRPRRGGAGLSPGALRVQDLSVICWRMDPLLAPFGG